MTFRLPLRILIAAALSAASLPALSAEFAALVSPPRFEAQAKTGTTYRDIVEIHNMGSSVAKYSIRTSDWELDERGQATFKNHLASGSCRPWVAIERKALEIKPKGKHRFRFQVDIPAGTAPGECRFAIMVEGEPQSPDPTKPLNVSGSIGVIVYVAHGGAAPDFAVTGSARANSGGAEVPALEIENKGLAHGRLEGLIDAVDATGRKVALYPSTLPILAGQKRVLPLSPASESKSEPPPALSYPVTLKGKADFSGKRMSVEGIVIR